MLDYSRNNKVSNSESHIETVFNYPLLRRGSHQVTYQNLSLLNGNKTPTRDVGGTTLLLVTVTSIYKS